MAQKPEYITKRTLTNRVAECINELIHGIRAMHILFELRDRSVIITIQMHKSKYADYEVWIAYQHGKTFEKQQTYFCKESEIIDSLYNDNPTVFKR